LKTLHINLYFSTKTLFRGNFGIENISMKSNKKFKICVKSLEKEYKNKPPETKGID
jgi:hypothetical protein